MGIVYTRMSNWTQCDSALHQASNLCSYDPMVFNELAVVAFRKGNYEEANSLLVKAFKLCKLPLQQCWEPIAYNLAHAYRKLKDYTNALACYQLSLTLRPAEHSTLSAIALTYFAMKDFDKAVLFCHKALSVRRDPFVVSLLRTCLTHSCAVPPY
eukprot:TRINITY_DN17864_c0_g1_i1.p1 TRINITY_DN17864_c0_g1~~TRINITY_DN17864_c0_g1_i1.p1  ORF type:complete len:155 (+),score=25.28 TRINITY_DN17864_c0_g1_i1:491-955(+)